MAYELEDEIDWSDSPLGPPSPEAHRAAEHPIGTWPAVEKPNDNHGLFVPENTDHYELPPGSPIHFSTHTPMEPRKVFAHMS
jgi:hypothetical protein